jgi:hypothetical protein
MSQSTIPAPTAPPPSPARAARGPWFALVRAEMMRLLAQLALR